MDGIEWKRDKWNSLAKIWFFINEKFACYFAHHLIADNPHIENYLHKYVTPHKITMIPYGGESINQPNESLLRTYGLQKHLFSLFIARPEPENKILEIVRSFSIKPRDTKLVILGDYSMSTCAFQATVLESASEDVIFLGAIYDKCTVGTLRYYCKFYIHGHSVGGTNPSLVEALGAGSAIIAHGNKYNRWVTGNGCIYFSDENDLEKIFDNEYYDDFKYRDNKLNSNNQFLNYFQWTFIFDEYLNLLNGVVKNDIC